MEAGTKEVIGTGIERKFDNRSNEDDPGVVLIDGDSSFSPNGLIKPLFENKNIGSAITQELSRKIAAQRTFLEYVTDLEFDDFREDGTEETGAYWTAIRKIDGDQYSFSFAMEEIISSIDLILVTSEEEKVKRAKDLDIEVGKTSITIDGQEYFVNMSIPLNFGIGPHDDFAMNMLLGIVADTALSASIAAIVAGFGLNAFKDALQHMATELFKLITVPIRALLNPMIRFAFVFTRQLLRRTSAKAALSIAASSAKGSFKRVFAGVSKKTFAYAFGSVVVLVAVWAFFTFVLHRSSQAVYVYNLTKRRLKFSIPYINFGEEKNTGGNDIEGESLVYIPRRDPQEWYNGSGFGFDSDSQWHGLGYTMNLDLMACKDNPSCDDVYQSFSCLFNIPFSGKNSLDCQLGKPADAENYFNSKHGVHKETEYYASNDEFEMFVTFDYLQKKHEDPVTGKEFFHYNSIAVIRDKNLIVER